MYLSYFSLKQKPFELLPNPDFLFLSNVHQKALTYLKYGLLENTGFILFTGEVGTGKTTIIHSLLRKMSKNVVIATVFNTQVNTTELLKMVNEDFGIPSSSNDKAELLRDLNEFLIEQYANGKRSVLIIDEAQNLGLEQLEQIRLLSNLETAQSKLLQIILVGQPELREKISSNELIQLRQRILVHCHLSPLNEEQVADYIYHRLEQAGNRNALEWHAGSIDLVHKATHGVPRLINILCDYILLDAFTKNQNFTNCDNISAILAQLDFETQFWGPLNETPSYTPAIESSSIANNSSNGWTPAEMNKLCDRMETCIELMQQSMLSLSQLVVLLSQNVVQNTTNQINTNSKACEDITSQENQ